MDQTEISFENFIWQDITNPSKEVMEQVAVDLGLSKKLVLNCLDPDYLPHVETYGSLENPVFFIVLRLMEPQTRMTADNVQELTTKVALFVGSSKVVSIHRLPLSEIGEIDQKVSAINKEELSKFHILSLFFEQVSLGFNQPLTDLEHKLEKFEERMFQNQKTKSLLLEGYYIKRRDTSKCCGRAIS